MSKITVNLTVELEANGKPVNKAELQRVFDYILAPRDDGIKLNCGGYDFEGVEVTSAHMNLPPKKIPVGSWVRSKDIMKIVPIGSLVQGWNESSPRFVTSLGVYGIGHNHRILNQNLDDGYKWRTIYVNN